MVTNKYGLSRYIEESRKLLIRKACGYGCVICGSAIYQYEHVDPQFAEAREHDPDKITLLCGSCHEKVSRGFWSKQTIKDAMKDPICKRKGFSTFKLDVAKDGDFIVKIGKTSFINPKSIVQIDGIDILSIESPEDFASPPRISAIFFDRNGTEIASIVRNEWKGSINVFDIEAIGGILKVRGTAKNIDLVIKFTPPHSLSIESINMTYNNVLISGTSVKGFTVKYKKSSIELPTYLVDIQHAPFGYR